MSHCPTVQLCDISKPVESAAAPADSAPRRLSWPPRTSSWAGWPVGSSPPPPPPPWARCRRSAGSGWGWTSSPGSLAERTAAGRASLQNIYFPVMLLWCVAYLCCMITMIVQFSHYTPYLTKIFSLPATSEQLMIPPEPEPQRVLLINFPRFIVVNNLLSPVCRPWLYLIKQSNPPAWQS